MIYTTIVFMINYLRLLQLIQIDAEDAGFDILPT
jgi:hypothetical protein